MRECAGLTSSGYSCNLGKGDSHLIIRDQNIACLEIPVKLDLEGFEWADAHDTSCGHRQCSP